jgi:hypothetical protein
MKPLPVITLLSLAAAACSSAPHSIAEAVAKRADEFPKDSLVLVPPSDLPRLGQMVEPLGSGRARPTGATCFDVAPTRGAGLKRIEISYKAGQEFQAEVSQVAVKAGAHLRSDDEATMALEDLSVREGFGVPLRGSPCAFKTGTTTASVITSTVVAGRAEIVFSRNLTFGGQAGGGWGTGSASGSAGGSASQSGRLQGTNIVVTAAVTPVTVTLTDARKDLGVTPTPGTVVQFPAGLDGNVRVDSLQTATPDGIPVLAITANTMMNATAANVPSDLQACPVGRSVSLRPGAGCFVWNQTGASGVNVWFEAVTIDGAAHIVLHVEAYATTFAPRASVSGAG